ncbi:MAG TPA: hypothetical protein VFA18_06755 [Gemmataceae bacterium]|nr:hypothetical protein [Gemmataceae bacterium]
MTDLRKVLQVGQNIAIETLESGLKTITIQSAGQAGTRVLEVGCDYVLVEDASEDVRLRLPVHCIHTITPGASDSAAQAA